MKSKTVEKYNHKNISASIVSNNIYKEYFVNVDMSGSDDMKSSIPDLFAYLKKNEAKVLMQMVFGNCSAKEKIIKKMLELNGEVKWPVMAVEHDNGNYFSVSGMQFFAVSGVVLKELKLKDKVVGYKFEDEDAKYAYLCDMRPNDILKSKKEQVKEVYENVVQVLKQTDMDFSNVVRTWFYLDELLVWYREFNEARTDFFNENGIFVKLVPASTGIGAKNSEGMALANCIYAVKPKNEKVIIRKVDSPLQCEAINYKSAFSRAVEIQSGDVRKLFISGTASIDSNGKSMNAGDINKQIALTMKIVRAILKSRNMDWHNVTRVILYFKNKDMFSAFNQYCEVNNLPKFPFTIAYVTVCREELLFEIELDAVDSV